MLRQEARAATFIGDVGAAIPLWEEATLWLPPEARSAARTELARLYLEDGRRAEAAQTLIQAFEDARDDSERLTALGMLGSLYESLSAWQGAADIYGRYLEIGGDADAYVRFRRAMNAKALGDDAQALAELERIDTQDLPAAKRAEILEEVASARSRLGDVDGALSAYQQILGFAQQRAYRGLVQQQSAQALADAKRVSDASRAFRRIIAEYPDTKAAALSLQALEDLGAADEMTALEKGRAYLASGDAQRAEPLLQTSVARARPADKAEALYLLGQAQSRLGRYAEAIPTFVAAAAAISSLPRTEREKASELLGDVRLANALAVAKSGADAAAQYYALWRDMPEYSRAADALFQAAFWAESELGWNKAEAYYHAFAEAYPQDARADEARFREGLGAYAQQRYGQASAVWMNELSRLAATDNVARARTLTWLGLAARGLGDTRTAEALWGEAEAAAPEAYYGLRARDLREGITLRLDETISLDIPPEPGTADWDAVSRWVGQWYTATAPLTDSLRARRIERRGEALAALGWHRDAGDAFSQAIQVVKDNPADLAEIIQRLYEGRWFAPAITAGERLLRLARDANAEPPPMPVMRVVYPLAYGDLVQRHAAALGLDPLLFMALVRQESRFDPRAVSYAGATGLTQVMPATGAWIAEKMGIAGFAPALLARPAVSVQFGTWYLAALLRSNDRDWLVSLVGYNAGPGNLQRWTGGTPVSDHDLFYEMLPSQQPKDYVRLVYENYLAYQRLYRQEGSPSIQRASP